MKNTLLIYDEQILAENIIENGYTNREFNYYEAVLVSKYFRHVLGYGVAKTRTELNSFSVIHSDFFFPDNKYIRRRVGRILKSSDNDFRKTGSVGITKSDIETARTIKNFKAQKIFLALVFLARRECNNFWIGESDKPNVKRVLSKNITRAEIEDVLFICDENDWIRNGRGDGVIFKDLKQDDIVILIDDDKKARNLGEIYKQYCGGELGYCKECGAEFIKNSTRHRYCETHSREKELERKRKYWRKIN